MNTPLVSCVLPVYNGSKFIREAIDSILSQTLPDFELILVDDRSTDDSLEILNFYAAMDYRIRILENKTNLGLPATLNRGVEVAKGKYIARMDQDDIALEHRFERQVRYLSDNSHVAIVGSNWKYFPNSNIIIEVPTNHSRIKIATLLNNPFGHPTVMFDRNRVLDTVGKYSVSSYPVEDYEFWCRCLDKVHCANLPEVLLNYRIHSVQSSSIHSSNQVTLSRSLQIGQLKKTLISEQDAELVIDWIHRRVGWSTSVAGSLFKCLFSNFRVRAFSPYYLFNLLVFRKI